MLRRHTVKQGTARGHAERAVCRGFPVVMHEEPRTRVLLPSGEEKSVTSLMRELHQEPKM